MPFRLDPELIGLALPFGKLSETLRASLTTYGIIKRHRGRLIGTAKVPQKADCIAAPQRTRIECQTRSPYRTTVDQPCCIGEIVKLVPTSVSSYDYSITAPVEAGELDAHVTSERR